MKKYKNDTIGLEEEKAVSRVVQAGELSGFLGRGGAKFYGGVNVRKLETNFEKYFGVKHAVSFNSATTALQAAVLALGIGPGDQVITSPFTMSATATAVLFNNAVPVFADIDPQSYCLTAESIEKRITKQTKAVIVVNLFGGVADYEPILKLARKYRLKIIEDNAQAPGAKYRGRYAGTIGDIGVFSFNVHKTIQSGEGGMLVTNNRKYAYRAQLLRNHGESVADDWWNEKEKRELVVGSNFRLTEIQAAIMIEQLKKLEKFNRVRIKLADYLTAKLRNFAWLKPVQILPKNSHVYYLYPIQFNEKKIGLSRAEFVEFMKGAGFDLNAGYQKPLYLMPIYQHKRIYPYSQFPFVSQEYPQKVSYHQGICPVAERMYDKELLVTSLCRLPRTKKDIDQFVTALARAESHAQ